MSKWLSWTKCCVCDDVECVSSRHQFSNAPMCDTCFDEECNTALNSGKGDSQIDGKAFNEIKQTNLRRK